MRHQDIKVGDVIRSEDVLMGTEDICEILALQYLDGPGKPPQVKLRVLSRGGPLYEYARRNSASVIGGVGLKWDLWELHVPFLNKKKAREALGVK